jgi:hypothetical protein
MKKINHVERLVNNEGKDEDLLDFYDQLVKQAAGAQEAEHIFEECAAKLEALGVSEHDATHILMQYGMATQENGFNGGFEYGFQQGGLLGAYGRSKAS